MLGCFAQATWGTAWWGWHIDLNPTCGTLLTVLLGGAGLPVLGVALQAALNTGTLAAAAAAAAGLVLGAAAAAAVGVIGGVIIIGLAIDAVILAAGIPASMTARGVSVCGTWIPGIVWASGR